MKNTIVYVITGIVLVYVFLIQVDIIQSNMEYIVSTVNHKKYKVRILPDKQEACDLLGRTHQTLEKVCKILEKEHREDERVQRLLKRFPYCTLQESNGKGTETSFSINKGEKIVLCVRAKDGSNTLVDENLLLFVALHELSHIMTISIGHTEEFWENFTFVLEVCQKHNIYKCIDFSSNPKKYCGITVTSSPLQCKA